MDSATQRIPGQAPSNRGSAKLNFRSLVSVSLCLSLWPSIGRTADSPESSFCDFENQSSLSVLGGIPASRTLSHSGVVLYAEPRLRAQGDNWRLSSGARMAPKDAESWIGEKYRYGLWLSELALCARNSPSICLGRISPSPRWSGSAQAFLGIISPLDGFGLRLGSEEEHVPADLFATADLFGSFLLGISAKSEIWSWHASFSHRVLRDGLLGSYAPDELTFVRALGVKSFDEVVVAMAAGKRVGWHADSAVRVRNVSAQTDRGAAIAGDPVDMRVLARTSYGFTETVSLGGGILGLSQMRRARVLDSALAKTVSKKVDTSAMGGQFHIGLRGDWVELELAAGWIHKSKETLLTHDQWMVSSESGTEPWLLMSVGI